jgi:hypothetical protein
MFDLGDVKRKLASGKTVDELMSEFDWKGFESGVADIFSHNDFRTKLNFRFKNSKRYEIDLVAVRNNNVFCVDCKEWSMGRHKATALKTAVLKQEERVKEFKKFLRKNIVAKTVLKIENSADIVPLVVTLYDENIVKHGSTFVVPSWKLNTFLLNFESLL